MLGGWCSNSEDVLKHMHKVCSHDHRHMTLQDGRAKLAAIYPKSLCLAILRGVRDQLEQDGLCSLNGVGTVCEETSYDEEHYQDNRSIPILYARRN